MKNFALLFIIFSSFCFAQNSEKDEVQKAVNSLFTSIKTSDSTGIKNSFSKNAIVQTFAKNGEIITDSVAEFATSVGKSPKESLDERITFGSVQIDGNLASVWTPYQFYYKGKFSHCGANSFQLVKENGQWKIQYLIDTRRKENCEK